MPIDSRVALPVRAAWLVGSAPETIKNTSWDLFVLFFYGQVLGLRGSLIGLALAAILVVDALIDPYVGSLSDSLRNAPFGRRHTLMLAGTLPFALGFIAVFNPPTGLSQWELFAWLVAFGTTARVGISFYTVPAFAVGVELSRQPVERATLIALRNIGGNLGMLSVTVLAFRTFFESTPEYPRGQLNPEPYPAFGLAFGALALCCMLTGILGTQRRIRAAEALEPSHRQAFERAPALRTLLHALSEAMHRTPNVRRLLALSLSVAMLTSILTTLTLHLSTYLWQLSGPQTERLLVGGILGSFIAYVSAPLVVPRFERRSLMIGCIAIYFACAFASIALPLAGVGPGAGSAALGILVLVLRFTGGLGYGWYLVGTGSLSADVSDEHEVNTGRPQQGVVMSLVFLGMQAAGALAGIAVGVLLDVVDFPRGVPIAQMPADKVSALGLFVCAIFLVGGSLLGLVIRGFDVSREKQALVNRRLAALRGGATENAG